MKPVVKEKFDFEYGDSSKMLTHFIFCDYWDFVPKNKLNDEHSIKPCPPHVVFFDRDTDEGNQAVYSVEKRVQI